MKIISQIFFIAILSSIFAGCSKDNPKPNMADIKGKEIRDRADKAWKEIK